MDNWRIKLGETTLEYCRAAKHMRSGLEGPYSRGTMEPGPLWKPRTGEKHQPGAFSCSQLLPMSRGRIALSFVALVVFFVCLFWLRSFFPHKGQPSKIRQCKDGKRPPWSQRNEIKKKKTLHIKSIILHHAKASAKAALNIQRMKDLTKRGVKGHLKLK